MKPPFRFERAAAFALGAFALLACGSLVKVEGAGGATAASSSSPSASTTTTITTATSTSGGGGGPTSASGGVGGSVDGWIGACCAGAVNAPSVCSPSFECRPSFPDGSGTCAMPGQPVVGEGERCGGVFPAPLCDCHQVCVTENPDSGGHCAPHCQSNQDCATGLCGSEGYCVCTNDAQCGAKPMQFCHVQSGICWAL